MQRPIRIKLPAFFLALLAGCNPTPPPGPARPAKPLDGQALTVGCADAAMARLLTGRLAGWAAATGATVTSAPVETSDLVVIPAEELGAFAAAGKLAPLPAEFRALDDPLQRMRMIEVYRDTLSSWGGTAVALPVAGDGFVLVSRRDILADEKVIDAGRAKNSRDPTPPQTYEEWAELAALVGSATGKPALAALPPDDATLLADYQRIVTCYDRPAALTQAAAGSPALALHYVVDTLEPRLTTPGFVRAAEYLARVQKLRQKEATDPVAALEAGAVCQILSLREVGQLPREGGAVAARYTVSPLPGTRSYFQAGQSIEAVGRGNFVPFVGSGTFVVAVRSSAAHPAAAWAFAAELAGVGSRATLADPTVGAGPFRREDLEASRESVWLGYRLAASETKHLADALREAVAVNVVNSATVLRTPDQAARLAELAKALRRIAAGEVAPAVGLAEVESAWRARDAALTPSVAAVWKRRAANLP